MSRTLLALRADDGGVFDASSSPLTVKASGAKLAVDDDGRVAFDKTSRVTAKPDPALASLDEFTLVVEAAVERASAAQVLVDSDQVRLLVQRDGTVEAAVQTDRGWETVDSTAKMTPGTSHELRLVRASGGQVTFEVDGAVAGELAGGATLVGPGRTGLSVGTDTSGKRGFVGTLGSFELLDTAATSATLKQQAAAARQTVTQLADRYRVPIRLIDDGTVDHRFDEIKGIMRAAGVEDLSELSTLTIAQPTTIRPNQILTAPRRTVVGGLHGSFADLATDFLAKVADPVEARALLDGIVVSRATQPIAAPLQPESVTSNVVGGAFSPSLRPLTPNLTPLLRSSQPSALTNLPSAALAASLQPVLSRQQIISALEKVEPQTWPTFRSDITMTKAMVRVLPVDSSVIIAGRLDLTNTTLEISPDVQTLYIIAEEVQAAAGASITWRRTPLSVPDMGPDPGKDGHGWGTSNVVRKPDSKHGQDGSDGRNGDNGIAGRAAADAPGIEIWAKRFVGMPDIDVAGGDGGRGGKGQRGGRGGSGARGRSGEWYWAFGKRCWSDPGDGGDGGNGGRGGDGGRGGNGGTGGQITLAVLPDTLTALVTTNAFTPLVNKGATGRGGDGGDGGAGGAGGQRGYTEVCDGGRAGHDGAQGQPGATGRDGSAGTDGLIQILTVTEESWNEQLTRPWVTHITPTSGFPGTTVTVRGSRFADTDRVVVGSTTLTPTLRADEGLDVALPDTMEGGEHTLFVRRHDGEESNRVKVGVLPHLDRAPDTVAPQGQIQLTGKAFVDGAAVSLDGDLYPASGVTRTSLSFTMPGVSGPVNGEQLIGLSVINPDGRESNRLTAVQPRILQNGFTLGVHDYQFANFKDGVPSWGTFEDTFGSAEVWHELLDPIFGHPILTGAFYIFYQHFLKGEDNGGLATGFCTSLASTALDRFWQGRNDTFATVTKATMHKELTAIHGRLLSRESLLTMHDQGRRGNANIETTFRAIEAAFASGGTRETAPLLFFIPSGAAWDSGYFDKLADSHCVVPIKIIYPSGHDGIDLNGIDIQVWDNNAPNDPNCRVELRRTAAGDLKFELFSAGSLKFGTNDGVTLGTQTVGQYLLSDVDLPFSGPLGLTSFIIDFVLSPATLAVTDGAGRRTGHFGGQILSEIPESHPAYLLPGLFLLPVGDGMTRTITGTGNGSYGYTSINPAGVSLNLREVPTSAGEADIVAANADGSRARFIPGQPKTITASVSTEFGGQARGVELQGFQASAIADLDVTVTPDLSLVRIANRGSDVSLPVKLLGVTAESQATVTRDLGSVALPANHDLVVAVGDWAGLPANQVTATAVPIG